MAKNISSYKNDKIVYNHRIFFAEENVQFDFHMHDICELIFLKKGNASAIIGNKIYRLSKNNLMIFRANTPHKIVIEPDCDYERYDLLLDENKLANRIFRRLPDSLTFINCSGSEPIIDLFKKFDFYCENFEKEDLEILMTNIAEEILFNLYLSPDNDFEGDILSINPIISKAVKFVNKHYTEDISIEDLCSHLCITKSHLHHLFVEFMQITPKKYINIKRLAKAQKLIRMGKKPSSVYTDCGFSDYATFFRNYSLHFGYKPSEENKIIKERKIES